MDHGAECTNERYTYVRNGIVKDMLTHAEADELLNKLSAALNPPTGITPAKAMARMRRNKPPTMRYRVNAQ